MYAASIRGRGALNGRESLGRSLTWRHQESGRPCYTLIREQGQQAGNPIDVDGYSGTGYWPHRRMIQRNAGTQLAAVIILTAFRVSLGMVDIQRRNNVAVHLIVPVRMPMHMRAKATKASLQAKQQQHGDEAREHQ